MLHTSVPLGSAFSVVGQPRSFSDVDGGLETFFNRRGSHVPGSPPTACHAEGALTR